MRNVVKLLSVFMVLSFGLSKMNAQRGSTYNTGIGILADVGDGTMAGPHVQEITQENLLYYSVVEPLTLVLCIITNSRLVVVQKDLLGISVWDLVSLSRKVVETQYSLSLLLLG